ncbi:dynein light chain roadblock-type 2-like [Anticarsia gemmatalis]|uniref:dynein light chain roadblock-type 2-like n=1 Tax=Anticarsia gemmatalis TaxID=129554 RepID=UPI003F773FFA
MEIAQNFMGPGATATMWRINENGCVVGTIIVNCEGFPETTTLDSLTAATYSTHMRNLSHYASNALKEIDVLDELVVLRLVSRKTEAVVAPDDEFHLIVVMRRNA